jgi:PAS domain S-box-containing protein
VPKPDSNPKARSGAQPAARRSSLQHRWNRIFAAMVVLSLSAGLTSTLLVQRLGDSSREAAEEIEQEGGAVARLRRAVESEHSTARQFLIGDATFAGSFLDRDAEVGVALRQVGEIMDEPDELVSMAEFRTRWDRLFEPFRSLAEAKAGFAELTEALGDLGVAGARIDDQMEAVRAGLDEMAAIPLSEVSHNLERVKQAERGQLRVLYGILAASLGLTVSFIRRLRRDVLVPVQQLRTAASRLGAGELDERLDLDRDDEFGELVSTFNAMAGSLAASQRDLAAQARRTRLIIETARNAFVGMDEDGLITEWNRSAEEIFGWTPDEASGRDLAELIVPPSLRPVHWERLRRYLATGKDRVAGETIEISAIDKAGREFPVELSIWDLEEDGRHSFNAFLQDISERKRAGELQARLAAIVESTDEAIVAFTTDLVLTSWNGGAERLYGYSAEETLGRSIDFLLCPGNGNGSSILAQVAQGQRLTGYDTEVRTRDGRTVSVSLTASPIFDAEGGVIGIASIIHDITERQRFEQALRVSEQRFRSLVQKSSDLTLVCDAAGELTYVSPASHGILGLDDAWLIGRGLDDLVHPDDLDELRRRLDKAGGEAQIAECRVRHADGSFRRVEVTLTDLLEDPGLSGIVLNLRDVNDRHRLESELRHAQKLESVGQLASGIAHEINTPIQYLGDNVRFLQDAFGNMTRVLDAYRQVNGSDEPVGALEHARNLEIEADTAFLTEEIPLAIDQTLDGVNRVGTIVRAMKAFGHPSNDEKAPADLNEAVRNTLVVANNQVKYVADVVTELAELPQVWCHLGDVNQVLLNLVINAAQAVAEAGQDTNQRGTITVRSFLDGDRAVIEVTDTGAGIRPEVARRIFEPFFTTKGVGMGTGQGLALAYSLIHDRHGGSITFSSEPGAGTTFTVRLPVDGCQSTPIKEAVA